MPGWGRRGLWLIRLELPARLELLDVLAKDLAFVFIGRAIFGEHLVGHGDIGGAVAGIVPVELVSRPRLLQRVMQGAAELRRRPWAGIVIDDDEILRELR